MAESTVAGQPGAGTQAQQRSAAGQASDKSSGAPSAGAGAGDAGRSAETENLSGLDPEAAAAIAAEFGDIAPGAAAAVPLKDAPAKDGKTPDAAATEKGKQGEADSTTGKADDGSQVEPLPFEAELAGLEPLGGAPDPAVQELADLSTPEAIVKACNPDGKASETDQLKNAQGLLGRMSKTHGQASKLLAEIAPFIQTDEAGNPVGFDLVRIADKLGAETVQAQLQAAGLKLVPADWGPEQMALDREYPRDLVEQLVPDVQGRDKLTFEDKVELLKQNAEKLVDLRVAKRERELQAQHRQEQETAAGQSQMVSRLTELSQKDKGYGNLKPGMRAWNKVLPESITGALRADIVYRLAKLDRILDPKVGKAHVEAIHKRAMAEFAKAHGLVLPVGGGGVVPAAKGAKSGAEFPVLAKDEDL